MILSIKLITYLFNFHEGYTKIVTIPKGARNIFAAELKPSDNSLAIKLEKSGTYCFNGNL